MALGCKHMKLPRVLSLETLGFVVVVALFVGFGQSVGWRAVGVLQLVFSLQVLRRREVAVGWEGRNPSFHMRGLWALLVGVVSLGLAAMLLFFPEQTVMKLGPQ
jgi:hypothetical protein